jgi:hypothetical protein
VLDDVLNEFITFDYAFDVYGVAISNNSVDTEATATRRAELAAAKSDKPAYLNISVIRVSSFKLAPKLNSRLKLAIFCHSLGC